MSSSVVLCSRRSQSNRCFWFRQFTALTSVLRLPLTIDSFFPWGEFDLRRRPRPLVRRRKVAHLSIACNRTVRFDRTHYQSSFSTGDYFAYRYFTQLCSSCAIRLIALYEIFPRMYGWHYILRGSLHIQLAAMDWIRLVSIEIPSSAVTISPARASI